MYSTIFCCQDVSKGSIHPAGEGVRLAYMLDLPHDVHLVFYLLIQNAVFHEFPFIEFLRRERLTSEPLCDLVHGGEGAPANLTDPVVLV